MGEMVVRRRTLNLYIVKMTKYMFTSSIQAESKINYLQTKNYNDTFHTGEKKMVGDV